METPTLHILVPPGLSQQFLRKTVKESMAESLTPPLYKDPGIENRRCSHPPVRCRDLGSLSEADEAT